MNQEEADQDVADEVSEEVDSTVFFAIRTKFTASDMANLRSPTCMVRIQQLMLGINCEISNLFDCLNIECTESCVTRHAYLLVFTIMYCTLLFITFRLFYIATHCCFYISISLFYDMLVASALCLLIIINNNNNKLLLNKPQYTK